MTSRRSESWVVYRASLKGSEAGVNAVCEAAEWAALDRAEPGRHTLVRAGIGSETEAERLARGTSGDAVPRGTKRPAEAPAAVAAS